MTNITLFIPDELKKRMDEHSEMRWSRAIRSMIEQRLNDLEEFEQLVKKSKLTEIDAKRLANKINEAAGKHAEVLSHETRSGR